jgi:hypothetical protein
MFMSRLLIVMMFLIAVLLIPACARETEEQRLVKAVVVRYNQLVAECYRAHNMNPMQEVATKDQAEKLYIHMAAIGEGQLRLESTLKDIAFKKIDISKPDRATVETKEVWDFTNIDIKANKVFAQEKDFIYEMGYELNKKDGRWIVTNVVTVNGTSTNAVVPWPEVDRKGNRSYPVGKGPENAKPAGHP